MRWWSWKRWRNARPGTLRPRSHIGGTGRSDNRPVMANSYSLPAGRDRRRRDPASRVRRVLYGLLLALAAPGTIAADELAYFGQYRVLSQTAAPDRHFVTTVLGLVVLRHPPADIPDLVPRVGLDAVTARIQRPGSASAPNASISTSPRGTGFDLQVPEAAHFFLSLRLQRDGDNTAWSLGGTLETAEARPAAVPELRIQDLHRHEIRYLPFELSLVQPTDTDPHLAFRWRA